MDSPELWRHEMGPQVPMMSQHTYVIAAHGVVVAHFESVVKCLDAGTGAVRWSMPLACGRRHWVSLQVAGRTLYVGLRSSVSAVSLADGRVLWQRDVSEPHPYATLVPTVLPCGLSVFTLAFGTMSLLNAADGSVRWQTRAKEIMWSRFDGSSAAWDGENRVLVGHGGYLYPVDLDTGAERARICLPRTGFGSVGVAYDRQRRVFYAASASSLFALANDETHTFLWRFDMRRANKFPSMALDPASGNIHLATAKEVACVSPTGQPVYRMWAEGGRPFNVVKVPLLDLRGTGFYYVGEAGCFAAYNIEGRAVCCDNLKGMMYGNVTLCTDTASIDEQASCALINSEFGYRNQV